MKPNFEQRSLGDCAKFFSGGTPSKSNPDYWVGSIPWVSCKDMKVPRLYDAEDHLSEEGCKKGTRLVQPGTILIVVRGMILAKEFPVAMAMREIAFNQDLKALCCKDGVDSWFLYYWLLANSYEVRGLVDEAAHGTTRLQSDRLLSLEVNLPPLETQRKIASILSAYDDLIENNTRRIKILEEMARMIYHNIVESHCNASLQAAALPEGWKIRKIKDVAKVNTDSIKKKSEPEYINYVDIASVTTGQIDKVELLTFNDAPGRARRIVKHGDVIWSMVRPNRKSYAMIIQPVEDMIVSTGFAVLTAVSIPYTYLFHAVTTDDFVGYLTNNAAGSAYPAVNASDFENADILVAPKNILDEFHKTTESIIFQCHKLQKKNHNLRQTRDLLLPKLISGEVDVTEMNIEIKELAS